jgi:hypothetical protein
MTRRFTVKPLTPERIVQNAVKRCTYCGKELVVPQGPDEEKTKYCSKKCQYANQRAGYRKAHSEELRAWFKNNYQVNRQKIREKRKQAYINNDGKEKQREYRKKNPIPHRLDVKARKQKLRANGGNFTPKQIRELLEKQMLCQKCNRAKSNKHPIEFMQSRGYLL